MKEFEMVFFNSILENRTVLWVTAFVTGFNTAISPCLLVTNITAVGLTSGIGNVYNKVDIFGLWFRRAIAIPFIAVGIYYIIRVFF